MRDYEELVKALREADSLSMCGECGYKGDKKGPLFAKAADAIEELQKRVDIEKAFSGVWEWSLESPYEKLTIIF